MSREEITNLSKQIEDLQEMMKPIYEAHLQTDYATIKEMADSYKAALRLGKFAMALLVFLSVAIGVLWQLRDFIRAFGKYLIK